jgi:ABC-2 type transport system permease protein
VIRLFRSELLRARSRRLVPMLLVGGVLLIVVALVIAAANSHRPSPEQIAAANAFSQKQFTRCMQGRFLAPGEPVPGGFTSLEDFCRQATTASTDVGLQLRDAPDIIEHTSTSTVLLGVVLGASLGGADWTAGTMATLLAWEPRRIRVFLIRALVVVLVVVAATLFLQILLLAGFRLAVALRGTSVGAPSTWLSDAGKAILRVAVVASAFGLIALALAMVGRSTVAAVGVLFGYLILFEGVIAGFRPSIADRLLVRAGEVLVSQQPIYDTSSGGSAVAQSTGQQPILLGLTEASVVLTVYVVVLAVVALLVFRARDVN